VEPPETRYADADGVRIAYQELGAGDRTLCFVTNWATNIEGIWHMEDWAAFADRVARRMRVLMLDMRGVGLSDRVSWALDPRDQVADIRAVLDAAAVSSATLVAYDMGSIPSLWFAATHPQRVDAVILLGGTARLVAAPDYNEGIDPQGLQRLGDIVLEGWGQADSTYNMGLMPGDANRRARGQMARVQRQAVSPSDVPGLVEHWLGLDARDAVPEVTAPTLLLHATDDLAVPIVQARWLARNLPAATLVETPGNEHFLWGEHLRGVLQHLFDFVGQARTEDDGVLAALVMTDIVGSTERAASVGAAAWRRTLDRHDEGIRDLLRRYDGEERSTAGDSFLATFRSVGSAARFALAAVKAGDADGVPLRIGLHVGDVVERDGGVHGLAIHVTARVQGAASPGQVAATSTVREALLGADDVRWEPLGEHALKGVPGTWMLWQATST
jgi:pimeloyl-ACP methyl ester carboxylesterase/class 3 adenylate cyclase